MNSQITQTIDFKEDDETDDGILHKIKDRLDAKLNDINQTILNYASLIL